MAIKNRKGQTPIDVATSKAIIKIFWVYLGGNIDENLSEENKELSTNENDFNDSFIPKLDVVTKTGLKEIVKPKHKPFKHENTQKRNGSDGLLIEVLQLFI